VIVTISGKQVPVHNKSVNIEWALGERSTCSFQVIDKGAKYHFRKGQPVEVWTGYPLDVQMNWQAGTADRVAVDPAGTVKLARKNYVPNAALVDIDANGIPDGWSAQLTNKIAYSVLPSDQGPFNRLRLDVLQDLTADDGWPGCEAFGSKRELDLGNISGQPVSFRVRMRVDNLTKGRIGIWCHWWLSDGTSMSNDIVVLSGDPRINAGWFDIVQTSIAPTFDDGRYVRGIRTWRPGFREANAGASLQVEQMQIELGPTSTSYSLYYHPTGTWISQPIDLSKVKQAAENTVSWQADTPPGTAVTVEASLDGGQTWRQLENGGPLVDPGTRVKTAIFRVTLSTQDTSVTPVLHSLSLHMEPYGGGLIYAGYVDSAKEVRVAPGVLFHTIECVDNHYLADKRIVASGWENTTAGQIVRDVLNGWLAQEGVTEGEIHEGPLILEAVANYRPASEVIEAIAEKAGFIWWIDQHRRLYFVDRATYAAPWEATGDGLQDVEVELQNHAYRNRQFIRGVRDVTDPQVEVKRADGVATSFTVGFPIAKVPTVEVSFDGGKTWTPQTVGIKGVEEGKDWYWSKGDHVITQEYNVDPLPEGALIRITYQGEFDVVVLAEDNAAIEELRQVEGISSGIVEDVADEMNLNSAEAAFQLANAKLRQYATIGRIIRYKTRRPGLRPGQIQRVALAEHNLYGDLLIERVTATTEGPIVWYSVQAVQGTGTGSWTKLFAMLARRGQAFVERVNIGEAKTVVILHQVEEAVMWREQVAQIVHACPVPSPNLYPSETLYPC